MSDANRHEDYQRILDNLNTAILLFGPDLRLRYMNPSAEMLFAVSVRHLVGKPADSLIRCPGEQPERQLARVFAAGHPITERELPLVLNEQRQVTVDCTAIPLTHRDGEAGLLVELQQVDRQLRISREEALLAQHEAVRDLVRGMAHEIKNPLGGLRGAAQLLELELGEGPLREYTQIIINEADRLQSLVDRMLGPNKLPKPQEVNLHILLERVRNLVLAEWGEKLHIERDYDPSIPELRADPDRIIQALLNIVRNAARAVSAQADGRIVLRTRVMRQFTIGSTRHRLVAEIGIEDNGPGVPEAIVDKLFYPMVTASEGGTGLGLSISQALINQHAGLVECESRPGHTLFRVLLPLEMRYGEKT